MAVMTEKPKGMLTPETDSKDPYSNQFPIIGPTDDRYKDTNKTGIGMADIDTENSHTDGLHIIIDVDEDEGAGMKNGGLVGGHSFDH